VPCLDPGRPGHAAHLGACNDLLQYRLVSSNPQIAGGKNIDILLGESRGAEASGHQP
jgi:hypothetical protein